MNRKFNFILVIVFIVSVLLAQDYNSMSLEDLENVMNVTLKNGGFWYVKGFIIKDEVSDVVTFKFDFIQRMSIKEYTLAISKCASFVGFIIKNVSWKSHNKICFTENSYKDPVAWFYTEDARKILAFKEQKERGKFIWNHIHWLGKNKEHAKKFMKMMKKSAKILY